jgi:hypothetical protein
VCGLGGIEALGCGAALFLDRLGQLRLGASLGASDCLCGAALLGGELACRLLARLLELGGHALGLEMRLQQLRIELGDAPAQLVRALGECGVCVLGPGERRLCGGRARALRLKGRLEVADARGKLAPDGAERCDLLAGGIKLAAHVHELGLRRADGKPRGVAVADRLVALGACLHPL